MSTDPLSRLSAVPTPAPRFDLDGVQRRALARRRARRTRLGIGTAALATVLTVGGVVVPQLGSDGTGSGGAAQAAAALGLGVAPASAADEGAQCDVATVETVARSDWSDLAQVTGAATLIDEAPWGLTSVDVRKSTVSCVPALPVLVLLDTDPVRGLTLWSDVSDPFPASVEDEVVDVTVRGGAGRFRDLGSGMYVTWLDDAGTRWLAAGSGLTRDELLADLNGLTLDGGTADPTAVPDGFEVVPVTDAPADPVSYLWWAMYGDTQTTVQDEAGVYGPVLGGGVWLEVSTARSAPPEVTASYWAAETVLVDVDGHRGVFAPWGDPATDVGGSLDWQVDGVTYRLSGAVPVEELAALAAQVRPVGLDDARLVDVPDMAHAG
jgi:hypothetical protein